LLLFASIIILFVDVLGNQMKLALISQHVPHWFAVKYY